MTEEEMDLSSLPASEVFRLLESNKPKVVEEIQRMFHESLSETREGWLVTGLYEYYCTSRSANSLKLLLNVREPHDRLLCDRLAEGLRCVGEKQTRALDMLGYIVRKQPTWLHKVTGHNLLRDLLKLLRTETEVVPLVSSLLVLLSLLPVVSAKLSPFLQDLFEVFGRLAAYRCQPEARGLSELSSTHLAVSLYAYFHRLYGMFPCNFLSWLRTQYPDYSSTSSQVFSEVVCPLLATVRLHPLLVTQSREQEKTTGRWKGLAEVHDVVAECSKYSLDPLEAASREPPDHGLAPLRPLVSGTPSKIEVGPCILPPKARAGLVSKFVLDSPPEAAVEATPDNTPYATPVKDSPIKRQSQSHTPGHVRSLSFRSPGPASPTKPGPTSPTKEASPFRWPDPYPDSLFSEVPPSALSKRDSLGLGSLSSALVQKARAGELSETSEPSRVPKVNHRPSPVKFTKELQLQQSPQKPVVENLGARYNMDRAKLLAVQDPTLDLSRDTETMDAEVSSITDGCSGDGRVLSTRHITPHMFPTESPLTPCSGQVSRVSPVTPACDPAPQHPGLAGVDELVRKVRKRVRCITLCEPPPSMNKTPLSRALSCPSLVLSLPCTSSSKTSPELGGKLRFSSGTQTEGLTGPLLPYEHLFPLALPIPSSPAPPSPHTLLDDCLRRAASLATRRELQSEVGLLHSQLQFEAGRREVLGSRNRRLLGVTKGVREMEEKSLALEDQLAMVQEEVESLHGQLAGLRSSKHQTETERAESSRVQDGVIQELEREVERLSLANRELEQKTREKEEVARQALATADEARGKLFQAEARVSEFLKKEEVWRSSKAEKEELERQLLLQGELVNRYRERLEQVPLVAREQENKLLQEAAQQEVSAAKSSLLHKCQELTAALGRVGELEGRVADLESGITEQREMMESVQEENREQLVASEERAGAVRAVNIHLESQVLELQERLERLVRGRGRGQGTIQGREQGTSPVLSVSGSQGSDTGEYIRSSLMRGVEIPVNSGVVVSGGGSSGVVGSAHSVLHRDFGGTLGGSNGN